jgi:hypothetical protein
VLRMSGWNTSTRFLPAAFAAYIAVSASRSRSVAVEPRRRTRFRCSRPPGWRARRCPPVPGSPPGCGRRCPRRRSRDRCRGRRRTRRRRGGLPCRWRAGTG